MKRLLFFVWLLSACNDPKAEQTIHKKVVEFSGELDLREVYCSFEKYCGCWGRCFGKTSSGFHVYFRCGNKSDGACAVYEVKLVQTGVEKEIRD
jgi:hypothetical protein